MIQAHPSFIIFRDARGYLTLQQLLRVVDPLTRVALAARLILLDPGAVAAAAKMLGGSGGAPSFPETIVQAVARLTPLGLFGFSPPPLGLLEFPLVLLRTCSRLCSGYQCRRLGRLLVGQHLPVCLLLFGGLLADRCGRVHLGLDGVP